jgi:hypothetical protein
VLTASLTSLTQEDEFYDAHQSFLGSLQASVSSLMSSNYASATAGLCGSSTPDFSVVHDLTASIRQVSPATAQQAWTCPHMCDWI